MRRELVLAAGVRVSPVVTAPKTTAHGTPQVDEDGEAMLTPSQATQIELDMAA